MALFSTSATEPLAPVGAYLTDGRRLVLVLEADETGALCEDAVSELLVELHRENLAQWRFVATAE